MDIQHLFRSSHLELLTKILKALVCCSRGARHQCGGREPSQGGREPTGHPMEDPEASSNDRFVALELLKNACASASKALSLAFPGENRALLSSIEMCRSCAVAEVRAWGLEVEALRVFVERVEALNGRA